MSELDSVLPSAASLVNNPALDFTAPAVMSDGSVVEKFNLKSFVNNKYLVLFFYPLDFTFVCPTEILAFNNRLDEFQKLGTEIVGISVDSRFSHIAWRKTELSKGGIGDINFPLVSDISHSISRSYGLLVDNSIALRGTFLIDKQFEIQHFSVNNFALGRNVDEFLRLVKALKYMEKNSGEVCPANWNDGKEAVVPTETGISDYLVSNAEDV